MESTFWNNMGFGTLFGTKHFLEKILQHLLEHFCCIKNNRPSFLSVKPSKIPSSASNSIWYLESFCNILGKCFTKCQKFMYSWIFILEKCIPGYWWRYSPIFLMGWYKFLYVTLSFYCNVKFVFNDISFHSYSYWWMLRS